MSLADEDDVPEGAESEEIEAGKGKSSAYWQNRLKDAERAMEAWNRRCDNIDKLYANVEKLANLGRSREMQLFWANMQTLQPSIYARPPIPAVTVRFGDRRPVPRTAAELLERCSIVGFENSHLDRALRMVRNDLVRLGRGVLWPRYETKTDNGDGKKVCVDFKFRRDFLHDPARWWQEVGWVAAASYLTKQEMRKRFHKHSGKAYLDADYSRRKDNHGETVDYRTTAKVWEIWSKWDNRVFWVTEGCELILDDAEPHLTLDDFFPCPEPAYGTLQPESMVPVPDVMQYRDQLEEVNTLTGRISSLSDAVKVRGFYPAGAGDLGDAIEAAVKTLSDNVTLVPVSNWAMTGDGDANKLVVWWPLNQIVETIAQLVQLRQQLIQDIYEVSGVSDIQRGQSNPNETLGAQQLKAQTGSVRIRDRQEEMVRLSRDLTRINAEIMAEEFDAQSLLAMSQMELPSDSDIAAQVKALEGQAKQLQQAVAAEMAKPENQQAAQENPEEAQKALQEAEQRGQAILQQVEKTKGTVTIDQVMKLLRDQRLRPFILDIETDSTIVPDENAAKERATEYVTAMTGLFGALVPGVQQVPQLAPVAGELIKHVNGVFRVGRQFAQVVEEFTDQIQQTASQPQGPPPEQVKAEAEAQAQQARTQIEVQKGQADAAHTAAEAQRIQIENQARQQEIADKAATAEAQRQQQAEKHAQEMEAGALKNELAAIQLEQAEVNMMTSLVPAEGAAPPAGERPQRRATTSSRRIEEGLEALGARIDALAQAMVQQSASSQASIERLAQYITAPVVLERDEQGRPVGARKVMN